MLESTPSDDSPIPEDESIKSYLRRGLEYRAVQLVIRAYKKMSIKRTYPSEEEEERFSAILLNYIEELCPEFARFTGQIWDAVREYYLDDELVRTGKANPRKVPRIDIVISTWQAIGEKKIKLPFESKLLDENNTKLTSLYVKEGIVDRYLTTKNYADDKFWGGMIGYILQGQHDVIVAKLNGQIDFQLHDPTNYLMISTPIEQFDAIYTSLHQHPKLKGQLTVTHLLLTFQKALPQIAEAF